MRMRSEEEKHLNGSRALPYVFNSLRLFTKIIVLLFREINVKLSMKFHINGILWSHNYFRHSLTYTHTHCPHVK